ncbi:MAG: protein kinase domain-containing protein [Anaerolineales bacterium]
MENLTGKQFGPYRIVAPVGEGGMAAVFKAYQPSIDRDVALKVLPRHFANDPQFVARFQREAKILAKLQHPHILPVHDFGEAEGYAYIVMPYVPSGTLAGVLKGRPLALPRIELIVTQVGAALEYAHARGLIHRDIKPSNILIDESGNCLLSDFGLAKILEGAATLTATGAIMGTPAYMSPEQGLGEKLDPRTDIYSLGVVLYEMASGRVPYAAETPMAVIIKHINDPLPLPRKVNPALPEAVERVILKSLAKSPADRYLSAGEFVGGLAAAVGALPLEQVAPPTGAASTRLADSAPRQVKSTWPRLALSVGGLVVLAGIGALAATGARTRTPAGSSDPATGASSVTIDPGTFPESKPTAEELAVEEVPTDELFVSEPASTEEHVEPDEAPIKIVGSFPDPGGFIGGITWDGDNFWLSRISSIIKTDPAGQLLDEFDYEAIPRGLAWDGSSLWMFEERFDGPPWDVISRFRADQGAIKSVSSFEFSVGGSFGQGINDLEWDGEALWVSEFNQHKVFRIDPTGGILTSFVYPEPIRGLAWDGSYLWLAYEDIASFEQTLAVVDSSGNELISILSPISSISGLAWADGHLWAIGFERFAGGKAVYQLDASRALDELP